MANIKFIRKLVLYQAEHDNHHQRYGFKTIQNGMEEPGVLEVLRE